MIYPPRPHQEHDLAKIERLIRDFPFAHLFTGEKDALCVTRIPFALDIDAGEVCRLRAHVNAHNPQSHSLNGVEALVAFSGPDSYVSPNWRTASDRGATWDYTAVHVWGRVRIREDREFFERLIGDLAEVAEARFRGLSEKPDWSMKNVTDEYVERLRPKLCAFEIKVSRVEAVSKLHQNFPEADARRVAEHLVRSSDEKSRTVGALIEQRLEK